jgi:hypothetical protein
MNQWGKKKQTRNPNDDESEVDEELLNKVAVLVGTELFV